MSKVVTVVDYGAGNVRSVINAVEYLGWTVKMAATPDEILNAERLIFPGVGAFGSAMERLKSLGFVTPLREYVKTGKPFFGVCLGMQTLFESSEESPGVEGLGIIKGKISRFAVETGYSVPHMGWNQVNSWKENSTLIEEGARYYFVHSFVADVKDTPAEWVLGTTDYGGQKIVSAVQKGNVLAAQFHPEKSSKKGLELIRKFLEGEAADGAALFSLEKQNSKPKTVLGKRIIACLDVRANDQGDIIVTKGDQYAVREETGDKEVRNLGKPVDLAERYYEEGADEITFLNITSFRSSPLKDQPMLEVLRQASRRIFVPLCVGGGIRSFTDPDGTHRSALEVAGEYFRSGADKVSIGSDAVASVMTPSNEESSIQAISRVYGAQAVVISVDPKRVYGKSDKHETFTAIVPSESGETECWYQCTVKGGRETVDLSARELATGCEALGAGEILLNCIDHDGQNNGFDVSLIKDVKSHVGIPVIASSGAGCPKHFTEVFEQADPDAALAAGIFHRKEVRIEEVKEELRKSGVPVRTW